MKKTVLTLALSVFGANFACAQDAGVLTNKGVEINAVEAAQKGQISLLFRQWLSAVTTFAHQLGAAIPYNIPNSKMAVDYRPMFLYAGNGGASACRYPSVSGGMNFPPVTGLGVDLNAPVNFAGMTMNYAVMTDSEQIKAYHQVVGDRATFLPSDFKDFFDGVFCAVVDYNNPAPKKVSIVAWYAPNESNVGTNGFSASGREANISASSDLAESLSASGLDSGFFSAVGDQSKNDSGYKLSIIKSRKKDVGEGQGQVQQKDNDQNKHNR